MIKKLIFLVDYVVRKKIFFPLLVFSFLGAQEVIEIKLIDGKVIRGEFVGTYMGYIHLLNGDNLSHFDCNDVQTATKFGYVNMFEYDCSKNTVTKEMLFHNTGVAQPYYEVYDKYLMRWIQAKY